MGFGVMPMMADMTPHSAVYYGGAGLEVGHEEHNVFCLSGVWVGGHKKLNVLYLSGIVLDGMGRRS